MHIKEPSPVSAFALLPCRSTQSLEASRSTMKDQSLRRVVSDAATEIDDIISSCKETSHVEVSAKAGAYEVESAECECCGLHEECTLDYIGLVKECYCGKWVCGLCSEAVKEQLKKFPDKALEEAIDNHTAFTKKFNATTRLNPTLSLAKSMTHAIKVSFRHGAAKLPVATKIARSNSCMPRIDTDHIDFKRENNRVLQ